MTEPLRQKRAHIWAREDNDWYAEDPAVSAALFAQERFDGMIYDPCCGRGHILQSAEAAGYGVYGSDIVKRSEWCREVEDYLESDDGQLGGSIVTNPPFKLLPEFVAKIAGGGCSGKSAILIPATWLHSERRREWLKQFPIYKVLAITPRPSMPPGDFWESGGKPGNGTKDFSWLINLPGYTGPITFGWVSLNAIKRTE